MLVSDYDIDANSIKYVKNIYEKRIRELERVVEVQNIALNAINKDKEDKSNFQECDYSKKEEYVVDTKTGSLFDTIEESNDYQDVLGIASQIKDIFKEAYVDAKEEINSMFEIKIEEEKFPEDLVFCSAVESGQCPGANDCKRSIQNFNSKEEIDFINTCGSVIRFEECVSNEFKMFEAK